MVVLTKISDIGLKSCYTEFAEPVINLTHRVTDDCVVVFSGFFFFFSVFLFFLTRPVLKLGSLHSAPTIGVYTDQ